jgi:hypothetical protein
MKYKTCKKCEQTFEPAEAFFRKRNDRRRLTAVSHQRLHAVCIGCELTARTERKKTNRPREKARRTRQAHADKYIKRSVIKDRSDFAQRYGWDLDQMAHDIQHAYQNGCPYCHQMFAEMVHGLADVTLDIINPELLPYYETNVKWVCMTCNREKKKTSPDLWGAKLQCWKQWREHQEALKHDPYLGTMFEGLGFGISGTRQSVFKFNHV